MPAPEIYNFLAQRQSASILVEPKPDRSTVEKILQVGGTVPDHGGLKPYRFVVVEGEGREKFAESMVNAAMEAKGTLDDKKKAKLKSKAYASPLQVVIVFSPEEDDKIPEWEQMASASCTGYAVVLAANALGFGAVWKSFGFEPGSLMQQTFQLKKNERILGWVNIGTEMDRERSSRTPLDLKKFAFFLS
ncbi:MAG TPA: nitroreductase [Oligoflexus sp.]|uniref:nitroreductase family protein n=1 Tax=Oligoflexus sp. TaxID=1971216 RepID=UPI002D4015C7|nr:nitroreductase [Oligoflexus sp.]HYX36579.1 nitroreductase [Oligoflexus sp.]